MAATLTHAAGAVLSDAMSTLAQLEAVAHGGRAPGLDGDALARVQASRALVERLVGEDQPVYGVTTGFGNLVNVRIPSADTAQLQVNLIRSHAVGTGEPLAREVVRGMIFLLARSLARGYSGVRPRVIELLLALLEHDVVPVVPSRGSVGASGDLAPLAHLSLVLLGDGEAWVDGERLEGGEALARAGLVPLELTEKEGLALLNGTHLMAAAGTLAVREAGRLLEAAIVAGALSVEALKGSIGPFDARLHAVRPHPGQQRVASRLRELLHDSPIVASHAGCPRVQDPYTLRCLPQVLGAVDAALAYVTAALEHELEAVTDNPLLFAEEGAVISGGNFHGQPLALPLDHLGLAICELAAFSERRTYLLLSSPMPELPPFLTPRPGVSSGLMVAQYAAAALVNECQVLSHPAGAGSLPTSAGMEDFNSMGAWAALKARTITGHAARVVATELACACQAVEFHRPLHTTPALEEAIRRVRELVPRLEEDRPLAGELDRLADSLRSGALVLADGAPASEPALAS